MKAVWNNTVIAESDSTLVIEGNHYIRLIQSKRNSLMKAVRILHTVGKELQVTIPSKLMGN